MPARLVLRDELIAHLLDHQQRFPDRNWPVEMRDRWIVALPTVIEDCEIDRVLIIRGLPSIELVRKMQKHN